MVRSGIKSIENGASHKNQDNNVPATSQLSLLVVNRCDGRIEWSGERKDEGIGERNEQMDGWMYWTGLHWMCMMLIAVVEAE